MSGNIINEQKIHQKELEDSEIIQQKDKMKIVIIMFNRKRNVSKL